MDAEDRARAKSNQAKVLEHLMTYGVSTNHRLREIGGSRAMGRVHELQKAGHRITVTKRERSTWEVRYEPPLRVEATPMQWGQARQQELFR